MPRRTETRSGTSARTARRSGSSTRSGKYNSLTAEQRANVVLGTVDPLLEMFAMLDDVFTEDDALSAEKRQMSLGRVYEAWKRTRAALDPDWDPAERPRRKIGQRRGARLSR